MSKISAFAPVVCIVGFHHARGPEIEGWYGVEEGIDPAVENEWSFLPFMALSDGAHTSTEDFSYFTLRQRATPERAATSLFGISCTRQLDSNELLIRPKDVTRSTVQKALVVIADSPQFFGQLREKLSVVTQAWFAQRDFTDVEILKGFQESLEKNLQDTEDDRDQYLGVSLRELIHEFKHQTLVLFKCCLLQPKMLFFGSRCERLCMMQFSLISLIPGLIRSLEDCADPELDSYEKNLNMPTSLKTSERSSLLAYMGLPLQLFGKGSLFGPYTPLQQLDTLADYGTKSYIVGSTNSLLLQQKDRYSDILVNLDESTVSITSTSLRSALTLSAADRRWIDFLTTTITDTWDETNPSRPRTMGYMGSEEFIRLQFEEYLLTLLASVKYHDHLLRSPQSPLPDIEGDPALDFSLDWVEAWQATPNFALFNRYTDSQLFNIVEPRHPTAGGLSINDINRRLALQIQELHLDERLATSREALNKHLVTGQKKVSTAFHSLWAELEARREAQRQRFQEGQQATSHSSPSSSLSALPSPSAFATSSPFTSSASTPRYFDTAGLRSRAPDLTHAQASVSAAGQKAGAYLSSWGTWASERSKKGWGGKTGPGGGGGASGGENAKVGTGNEGSGTGLWGSGSGVWGSGQGGGGGGGGQTSGAFARASAAGEKTEAAVALSPRKKRGSREERGGDGIGRLDA